MGLKVNFSQNEASSTAREVVPSGSYLCNITDVETKQVNPGSQNSGKPYWNLRFTIDEGPYAGNNIFGNVMLFKTDKDGTLSSLAQLLKAIGYEIVEGDMELPEDEELSGKQVVVVGRKLLAGYDKKAGKELPDRFRISGYKKPSTQMKSGAGSSMLP